MSLPSYDLRRPAGVRRMCRRERLARGAVARCPLAIDVVQGMLDGCRPVDVCAEFGITQDLFATLIRQAFA